MAIPTPSSAACIAIALLSNDTSPAEWSGERRRAASNQCGHSLGMLDATIRVALSKSSGERSIDASSGVQTGTTALGNRSEEHTSELQSLMRISYAVFCLKKKK